MVHSTSGPYQRGVFGRKLVMYCFQEHPCLAGVRSLGVQYDTLDLMFDCHALGCLIDHSLDVAWPSGYLVDVLVYSVGGNE